MEVCAQGTAHKTEAWTSEEIQQGKQSGLVQSPVLEGPRREGMYASPALGQGQVPPGTVAGMRMMPCRSEV